MTLELGSVLPELRKGILMKSFPAPVMGCSYRLTWTRPSHQGARVIPRKTEIGQKTLGPGEARP